MSILSVRLSEQEKAALQRQAKEEGCTTATLVRRMILVKPIRTASDLLAEAESMMGDPRLGPVYLDYRA